MIEKLLEELLAGMTVEINVSITFRPADEKPHKVTCKDCGWTRTYDTLDTARRALRSHRNHCTTNDDQTEWIRRANGINGQ